MRRVSCVHSATWMFYYYVVRLCHSVILQTKCIPPPAPSVGLTAASVMMPFKPFSLFTENFAVSEFKQIIIFFIIKSCV